MSAKSYHNDSLKVYFSSMISLHVLEYLFINMSRKKKRISHQHMNNLKRINSQVETSNK